MSEQGQGGSEPPPQPGYPQQPPQPQQPQGQASWQQPQQPAQGQGYAAPPQPPPGAPPIATDPQTVEAGKTWAFLSYASFFVGFPIWIIPLAQKDNAFALYHAKQSGAAYIIGAVLGMAVAMIAFVTCGFGAVLFPLAMVPLVSAIHGLILVNNGEVREPALVFGLGDKIFSSIHAEPRQPQ